MGNNLSSIYGYGPDREQAMSSFAFALRGQDIPVGAFGWYRNFYGEEQRQFAPAILIVESGWFRVLFNDNDEGEYCKAIIASCGERLYLPSGESIVPGEVYSFRKKTWVPDSSLTDSGKYVFSNSIRF